MGVLTALVFDFTNGFHDTANAMATSITSTLRPKVAVTVAGCLNHPIAPGGHRHPANGTACPPTDQYGLHRGNSRIY